MDIQAHLDSYRSSVRKDTPEDVRAYAMEQEKPVYEKLMALINSMRLTTDLSLYKQQIQVHQKEMLNLCNRFVGLFVNLKEPSLNNFMELERRFGVVGLKFTGQMIRTRLHKHVGNIQCAIIPTYSPKYCRALPKDYVAMDADELSLFTYALTLRPQIAQEIVRRKRLQPWEKIVGVTIDVVAPPLALQITPLHNINTFDSVGDWTLPLFPSKDWLNEN